MVWGPHDLVPAFCGWCCLVGPFRPGPSACTGTVFNRVWSSWDENQHLQVRGLGGTGLSKGPIYLAQAYLKVNGATWWSTVKITNLTSSQQGKPPTIKNAWLYGVMALQSKNVVIMEAMVLSRKKVACPLQVGEVFLPQVEEFKYLGVLFTRDGMMEREINPYVLLGTFSSTKGCCWVLIWPQLFLCFSKWNDFWWQILF